MTTATETGRKRKKKKKTKQRGRAAWYAGARRVRREGAVPIADLAAPGLSKETLRRFITAGSRGVWLDGFKRGDSGFVSSAAALQRFLVQRAALFDLPGGQGPCCPGCSSTDTHRVPEADPYPVYRCEACAAIFAV